MDYDVGTIAGNEDVIRFLQRNLGLNHSSKMFIGGDQACFIQAQRFLHVQALSNGIPDNFYCLPGAFHLLEMHAMETITKLYWKFGIDYMAKLLRRPKAKELCADKSFEATDELFRAVYEGLGQCFVIAWGKWRINKKLANSSQHSSPPSSCHSSPPSSPHLKRAHNELEGGTNRSPAIRKSPFNAREKERLKAVFERVIDSVKIIEEVMSDIKPYLVGDHILPNLLASKGGRALKTNASYFDMEVLYIFQDSNDSERDEDLESEVGEETDVEELLMEGSESEEDDEIGEGNVSADDIFEQDIDLETGHHSD